MILRQWLGKGVSAIDEWRANGFAVRFFNVTIATGRKTAGNLTDNNLRGSSWL
jgi:hypothetical protein